MAFSSVSLKVLKFKVSQKLTDMADGCLIFFELIKHLKGDVQSLDWLLTCTHIFFFINPLHRTDALGAVLGQKNVQNMWV